MGKEGSFYPYTPTNIIFISQKADRAALEAKASRDWVDSTFERLDKEIREAKSHLIGQEEALRNAVEQINEDVEGKLDRMEIEPLKQYFGKCMYICMYVCTCMYICMYVQYMYVCTCMYACMYVHCMYVCMQCFPQDKY